MNKQSLTYPQHSLSKSFMLYILPGVLVTVAFVLFKPALDSHVYPSLMAFLLVILFIDVPLLLGIMLSEGKKQNGQLN